MSGHKQREEEFSLKQYFVPLTTTKAIHFIIIIGLIVYFNSLFNGFVWDDIAYILYNPSLRTLDIGTILGKNIFNLGGQYRPIASLYFTLMSMIFKDAPFFYHFLSIIFHIVNSILIFSLLKKFFTLNLSFFLALIFLVHPIQVESVTFAAVAGDKFFFLFGLLALLLFLKENISLKRGIIISSLLLLTLLSKETGILFFVMIFIYSIFYKKENIYFPILISIPVGILYAFLRFGIGGIYFAPQSMIVPIARLSLGQRLINIPEIFLYYLQTFFFPAKLVIMQYWVITTIDFMHFYLPLFLVFSFFSICLGLGVYLYKKNFKLFTVFIFFSAWFILGLIFHLQIFPLDMTVADRWFYFPIVGLLGMVGIVIQLFISAYHGNKHLPLILYSCGIIILLLLSVRTVVRNSDWHDNLALLTHDSKILNNFNLENNIGWEYQQRQKWPEALKHYKKSVALFPYAQNLNNLAHAYIALNDKQQARVIFYKVLNASDYQPESYSNQLAYSSYFVLHNYSPEIARDFIKKALAKSPRNGYLWADLAIVEYRLHNQNNAIAAAEKAKSLISTLAFDYLYTLITTKQEVPNNINITWQ